MSHISTIDTFDSKKYTPRQVEAEMDEWGQCNYDRYEGSWTGLYSWHDLSNKVFENEQAARNFLDSKSNDWYWCGVVSFKKEDDITGTKAYLKLKKQLDEAYEKRKEIVNKYNELDNKIHYADVKSAYIACRTCGSRIASKYIKWNKCPICHSDLRPQTVLDNLQKLNEKIGAINTTIKNINDQIQELKNQSARNSNNIWYMARAEVHC